MALRQHAVQAPEWAALDDIAIESYRINAGYETNGRLPGNVTHGIRATYTSGCRCDECTEANRVTQAKLREDRKRRLLADPSLAKHGVYSTYVNWGCRCDECTVAHSAACRNYHRTGSVVDDSWRETGRNDKRF